MPWRVRWDGDAAVSVARLLCVELRIVDATVSMMERSGLATCECDVPTRLRACPSSMQEPEGWLAQLVYGIWPPDASPMSTKGTGPPPPQYSHTLSRLR